MKYTKQSGLSLIAVALISMLVAALGMGFLYFMRYGHLPMQDMWARFGKAAAVISNDVKETTGLPTGSNEGPGMRQAATTSEGVRRCTLDGKTVYSDTLCLDTNPSTKKIKLNDSKGMEPPKTTIAKEDGGKGAESVYPASMSNEEMKKKIMEQALGKSAPASSADEDLRLKAMNRAIDKATR